MEGEFREMQLKNAGEIGVEEAASRVIGKQRGDRCSEQGLRVCH